MAEFRIATYNVNSVRSRLHIVIPWLESHKPAVLCMQETKTADPHFPAGDFEGAGYHVLFRERPRGAVSRSRRPKFLPMSSTVLKTEALLTQTG